MRRIFALLSAIMLLFTTIFHGAAPIYASPMNGSDAEVIEKDAEAEEAQEILPIQHEQPKQLPQGEDYQVEAMIQDADEVSLFYKQDVNAEAIAIPMERSGNKDLYTAVIPGDAISSSKLEYWFEVTNENENVTSLPYIVEVKEREPENQKQEETEDDQDAIPAINEEEMAIEHEAITSISDGANITFEANIKNAKDVTLQFQSGEKMVMQELPFTKIEGTENYTVEVSEIHLWSDNFKYNIIARDANGEEIIFPEEGYIEAAVQPEERDTQKFPPLLITEIAPHPDGYGFIELYNNTNQPINLEDYQLTYGVNNDTDQVWDLTEKEDKVIQPQEAFIVWVQDRALTADDFNKNYDAELTEKRFATVESSGLENNQEQTVMIHDNMGEEIIRASYSSLEEENQGIVYQYPSEGSEMQYVGLGETATPLALVNGQVPSKPVELEPVEVEEGTETNNAKAPSIGKPSVSLTDDSVTVEIEVTSEQELDEVQLHFSQSSALMEQTMPMQVEKDSVYKLTVPRNQIWSAQVQYYFTASTESNTATSETYEAVIPQPEVDPQTMPKLLITELTPDTANMNGADAYEFIEIYNNTDQPINMKDYQIIYRYPTETADQIWDITDDKVIDSQESFIVWIHNDGNQQATLDDFNEQYGLELTEDRVAIIQSAGLANGSERTLILADEFGNEIVQASYNDGSDDVFTDRGVMYKNPSKGNTMQKVGVAESISPLTVFPGQVPNEPVAIEMDAEVPIIGEPAIDVTDEEITIQLEVISEQTLQGVNLYISQSEAMGFESIMMEKTEEAAIYTASIPRSEIWSDKLNYYVVASNQAGRTTSEITLFDIPQEVIDYQAVPPLFITEVVPDSTNANGADAYEFIEVYNNTTEAIDYKDYTIRYRYPNTGAEGDLLWGPPANQEDIMIPSGETVVFWIINSGNTDLTSADFNAHYGTDLTEDKNLIKIYNNGMSNSAERTFAMATKSGYEISNVTYLDEAGVDDTVADKGILFRYPIDGSQTLKKSAPVFWMQHLEKSYQNKCREKRYKYLMTPRNQT